jgi:hypothetical protein
VEEAPIPRLRDLLAIAAALAALSFVAGCGGDGESATDDGSTPATSVVDSVDVRDCLLGQGWDSNYRSFRFPPDGAKGVGVTTPGGTGVAVIVAPSEESARQTATLSPGGFEFQVVGDDQRTLVGTQGGSLGDEDAQQVADCANGA